jgi:AGZA family xanthine/uracil permease-like MFS transporter
VRYIPLAAALGIIVWIGVIMTVQAFQAIPKHHAPAVALGFVPMLAGWVLTFIQGTLGAAGVSLDGAAPQLEQSLHLNGIVALSQGSLISSMTLSALLVFALERRFLMAAAWALGSALLSFVGLIHAGQITPQGIIGVFGWAAAPQFAAAYFVTALVLVACHFGQGRGWLGEAVEP